MNEWKKSDFLEGAIFREVDGFTEIYTVEPDNRYNTSFSINHGLVSFEGIDLEEVMETFGCTSIPVLEEALGANWKQCAVLTWFDMACKNEGTYLVCRRPFKNYNEAVKHMYRMAGCRGEELQFEIGRILTISTVHISPQTACLMDDDDTGIYAKRKYGYLIPTVSCTDGMPDDVRDCVNFAAEHGCDWLCLDADANPVPDLPVYEWD